MDKTQLKTGINLGGWISQFRNYDHNHFRTFITRDDIHRIAEWGFDHVRLPVDYVVLESDDKPGAYIESGFEYIEKCFDWCQDSGLKVILDLHKAPGYAFDNPENTTLFNTPALQERLSNLWSVLARRYGTRSDQVAFELLNEMVLPDSAPWNALYPRLVSRIRAYAPNSLIVIGGNNYNAAGELGNLVLLDDPRILYTFHYYLPMVITHYHASWLPHYKEYGKLISYPGPAIPPDPEFIKKYPGSEEHMEFRAGTYFDIKYLEQMLAPAVEFARRIDQPVYCGEFGVTDGAPLQNRLNWTKDFIQLLLQNNIGRAIWSYKGMAFGLVAYDGSIVSRELIRIAGMK